VPSISALFTSARCAINARTASRFPAFTASMTRVSPGAAAEAATDASSSSPAPAKCVIGIFVRSSN
jgi:hypothetical protein